MKIQKSAMTEAEFARYQSVAVTKNNLNNGVGLLVVVVLGVVGVGILLDISIPWIIAGLAVLGIVCYRQIKSLVDGFQSYSSAKKKFKPNAVTTGAAVGAGAGAVMFADEYGNYVPRESSENVFGTFEDIAIVDETIEEMKGNRPHGGGCLDNTPDDSKEYYRDIPLEEVLGSETIIDDGINFGSDSVIFDDEDFIPQDPDM